MPTSANTKEPLIFYFEEEEKGNDFTFYVARDENQTVVNSLIKPSPPADQEPAKTRKPERFSFAERIFIKNLKSTEESLKPSPAFWSNLQKRDANSPHEYLAAQLAAKAETKECFAKLIAGTADDEDEGELLKAIVGILNSAVTGHSLEKEPWADKALSNSNDKNFLDTLTDDDQKTRWQNRFILEQAFQDLDWETKEGRGLICSSYVGGYFSITFRKIKKSRGYQTDPYKSAGQRKDYLFSFSEYCELLFSEVFERTEPTERAHGLLIITGATKSGKSEITRGLIQLYLERKAGGDDRRPHLVTFEDPIERFFAKDPEKTSSPWAALKPSTIVDNRDYTPREKKKDANLLHDALNDALRQTPALFFVGETREKAEWKVLLDFAATGHLIVTTAHAGSLVEAMHKIFEALDVKTPADRSEIASKLLGLIHIRSGDLLLGTATKSPPTANGKSDEKPASTNILFPALWRRSTRGIASLTSDGLASLLPHRSRRNSNGNAKAGNNADGDESSCLGRRSLIEQLFEEPQTEKQLDTLFKDYSRTLTEFRTEAYMKAIQWDLEGV
jgi:hypothetical protein